MRSASFIEIEAKMSKATFQFPKNISQSNNTKDIIETKNKNRTEYFFVPIYNKIKNEYGLVTFLFYFIFRTISMKK